MSSPQTAIPTVRLCITKPARAHHSSLPESVPRCRSVTETAAPKAQSAHRALCLALLPHQDPQNTHWTRKCRAVLRQGSRRAAIGNLVLDLRQFLLDQFNSDALHGFTVASLLAGPHAMLCMLCSDWGVQRVQSTIRQQRSKQLPLRFATAICIATVAACESVVPVRSVTLPQAATSVRTHKQASKR